MIKLNLWILILLSSVNFTVQADDAPDARDSTFIRPRPNPLRERPNHPTRTYLRSTPGPNVEQRDDVQTVYGIQRQYWRGYANWGTADSYTMDDMNLVDKVRQSLQRHGYLSREARDIQIFANNQTITLVGHVSSISVRRKIEAIVKQTNGVLYVDNQLSTSLPPIMVPVPVEETQVVPTPVMPIPTPANPVIVAPQSPIPTVAPTPLVIPRR